MLFILTCIHYRSKSENLIQLVITHGVLKTTNIHSFLTPIYNELATLSQNGITVTIEGGVQLHANVHLLTFTGDTPAAAAIANHAGHMSLYGCRICKKEGIRPLNESGMFFVGKVRVNDMRTVYEYQNTFSQASQLLLFYITHTLTTGFALHRPTESLLPLLL